MNKFLKKLIVLIVSSFSLLNLSVCAANSNQDIFEQSMTDAYIVAGAGAGGALLGLSTLSFVEEPKDHLKNIIAGGAIGIIIGVGVVAWRQASMSADLYNKAARLKRHHPEAEFTTEMRSGWHRKNHYEISSNLGKSNAPANEFFNLQFDF